MLAGIRRRSSEGQLYPSKWLSFSATIIVMLSSGLNYTFSMWGPALKDQCGYSHGQLAGLATACSVGSYLNIAPGLFYDTLKRHHRWGPRATLIVGVACQLVGFLGLWMVATKKLQAPYWLVCLLGLVACNCGPWFETAAMITSVRNFEANRGIVVSLSKACLGLSAAFYTTLYQATYAPDAIGFLLLLAAVPAASVLCCVPFMGYVPFPQFEAAPQAYGFGIAYSAVAALVVYQLLNNLGSQQMPWGEHAWLRLPALGLLLTPVLMIPCICRSMFVQDESGKAGAGRPGTAARDEDGHGDDSSAVSSSPATEAGSGRSADFESGADLDTPLLQQAHAAPADASRGQELRQRNKTPGECLVSSQFWLIFFLHFVGSGVGFVLTSNLNGIMEALGGSGSEKAIALSMYSAANATGRAVSGIVPELLRKAFKLPRAFTYVICMAMLALVNSLMTHATALTASHIYAAGGLFCGIGMGLTPAVAADCLGVRNMASNYAMIQLGPALSSYVLAQVLFARLTKDPDTGSCHGASCFSLAFAVLAALCSLGLVVSVLLWFKTTRLYKKLEARDRMQLVQDTLRLKSLVQQDMLAKTDLDIARLDALVSDIVNGIDDAGETAGGIRREDLRRRCQQQLSGAAAAAGEVQGILQSLRMRRSRYLGSGLAQILEQQQQQLLEQQARHGFAAGSGLSSANDLQRLH